MLERAIIDHASPTLARLKLGNLFNHTMENGFSAKFATLSGQLLDRGVTMTILKIGVFLGYPLEDVLGFIENGGRNCLSCGCWKVYSNERAALQAFARFEKCKAVYQRLFASGCTLTRLTVAARTA